MKPQARDVPVLVELPVYCLLGVLGVLLKAWQRYSGGGSTSSSFFLTLFIVISVSFLNRSEVLRVEGVACIQSVKPSGANCFCTLGPYE